VNEKGGLSVGEEVDCMCIGSLPRRSSSAACV
jgi:hypothetical protein